jgi:hypothetical protein
MRAGVGAGIVLCCGLVALVGRPDRAAGFTQGVMWAGSIVPMGHEWITRLAAIELIDGPSTSYGDPRKKPEWKAKAANINLTGAEKEVARIKYEKQGYDPRFDAKYWPVYSAIMGERWVDIGGVNFPQAKWRDQYNCLDLVTQEPADVQYDHFMRRWNDADGVGGKTAAVESTKRFIQYFVNAATASDAEMHAWDGGAYAELVKVDRPYFLFGRALHLLEDSFSPDHAVRSGDDGYRQVLQVKSYLCANGSEQHAHYDPIDKTLGENFWLSGDVIWQSSIGTYEPRNMRNVALAATEATKDAWAAFIRVRAKPAAQRKNAAEIEAKAIAQHWLSFDEKLLVGWYDDPAHRGDTYVWAKNATGGPGTSQTACMARDWAGKTQAAKVKEFDDGRRQCLYNMRTVWEHRADVDPSLHLAYDWEWRGSDFETPPASWTILSTDSSWRVALRTRLDGNGYMRREGDSLYNDPKDGSPKVEFDLTGTTLDSVSFMAADDKGGYMNTPSKGTGWAKIWSSAKNGYFRLVRREDGYYNIINTYSKSYLWSSSYKPYVSGEGPGSNLDAQWEVRGLPEPFPLDGTYQFASSNLMLSLSQGVLRGNRRFTAADDTPFLIVVERQADGSFQLRLGKNYLSLAANGSITAAASRTGDGKRFVFENQRGNRYLIRNLADNRYWRLVPDGSGTAALKADVVGNCFRIDPCNPVITGPPADRRHGPGTDGPSDECGTQAVKPPDECLPPTSFAISLYQR